MVGVLQMHSAADWLLVKLNTNCIFRCALWMVDIWSFLNASHFHQFIPTFSLNVSKFLMRYMYIHEPMQPNTWSCCTYAHKITICLTFCSHFTVQCQYLYSNNKWIVAILVLNFYLQRFAIHHVSTVHAHHPVCVAVVLAGLEVPAV